MKPTDNSCFIIAEAGVNHNGDPDLAIELVERAVEMGADAVKFQSFSASKLVSRGTRTVPYQEANTAEKDQFAMLQRLELSSAVMRRVAERCRELGSIEFMSTPFDEEAADMLLELGMRRIKIPSGEITNLPLLHYLATKRAPLILSTGMASMAEVGVAIRVIKNTWGQLGDVQPGDLTLLHCTSNYPTLPRDVNLRAMLSMREEFGLRVGYSDHTAGILVPLLALGMGAVVIEKHFTLDRQMSGPDHRASLEPVEFKEMVTKIRIAEECLGNGVKEPRQSEVSVRDAVRRSIFAARDLDANQVLEASDLVLLRPGTGIPPSELSHILGRSTSRSIGAGKMIGWSDLV